MRAPRPPAAAIASRCDRSRCASFISTVAAHSARAPTARRRRRRRERRAALSAFADRAQVDGLACEGAAARAPSLQRLALDVTNPPPPQSSTSAGTARGSRASAARPPAPVLGERREDRRRDATARLRDVAAAPRRRAAPRSRWRRRAPPRPSARPRAASPRGCAAGTCTARRSAPRAVARRQQRARTRAPSPAAARRRSAPATRPAAPPARLPSALLDGGVAAAAGGGRAAGEPPRSAGRGSSLRLPRRGRARLGARRAEQQQRSFSSCSASAWTPRRRGGGLRLHPPTRPRLRRRVEWRPRPTTAAEIAASGRDAEDHAGIIALDRGELLSCRRAVPLRSSGTGSWRASGSAWLACSPCCAEFTSGGTGAFALEERARRRGSARSGAAEL